MLFLIISSHEEQEEQEEQDLLQTFVGMNSLQAALREKHTHSKHVTCEGIEDFCITTDLSAGNGSVPVKGCASKLICSPEADGLPGVLRANRTCCQGDFCNRGSIRGADLLLLVAPPLLLSVVQLS
ncbi:lymphocyte antigen 6E-like [Anoplopoma fimbria]|uniref:lymphocyte antigen 6E-like n=1 Tax=Anoplopoma fimbria TaxID=229290 RepID=UPI0023ED43E4|nr:lymphocyte antigen 6E-like [Anoplopoma fimbria]